MSISKVIQVKLKTKLHGSEVSRGCIKMKFLKRGRNADSYLEGTHDKQEMYLTVPLSFLLASSAQSPAAEEVWCHSTDSDGAGRLQGQHILIVQHVELHRGFVIALLGLFCLLPEENIEDSKEISIIFTVCNPESCYFPHLIKNQLC